MQSLWGKWGRGVRDGEPTLLVGFTDCEGCGGVVGS